MCSPESPDHDDVSQWLLDWGEEGDAVDEQLSRPWCRNGFNWQVARNGKWDRSGTATDGRGLQDAVALRHCHRLRFQHCPSRRGILQTCEEATWHAESHARLRDKSLGWAERWNAQCNTMWDPHLRRQQTSLRIDRPSSLVLSWMDWRKTIGREAGQERRKEETGGGKECQTRGRGKEESCWAWLAVIVWTRSQAESNAFQETSDSKGKGLGEIDPGTIGYSRAKRRNWLQWHTSAKRGPHEWQLLCGIHFGRCCCGKLNEAQSLATISQKDHSLFLPGSWYCLQCDIARVGQCKRWGLAPLVHSQLQHDQHASLPLFLESGSDDDSHWPLQYPGDLQRHSGFGQEAPMQVWNGHHRGSSSPWCWPTLVWSDPSGTHSSHHRHDVPHTLEPEAYQQSRIRPSECDGQSGFESFPTSVGQDVWCKPHCGSIQGWLGLCEDSHSSREESVRDHLAELHLHGPRRNTDPYWRGGFRGWPHQYDEGNSEGVRNPNLCCNSWWRCIPWVEGQLADHRSSHVWRAQQKWDSLHTQQHDVERCICTCREHNVPFHPEERPRGHLGTFGPAPPKTEDSHCMLIGLEYRSTIERIGHL